MPVPGTIADYSTASLAVVAIAWVVKMFLGKSDAHDDKLIEQFTRSLDLQSDSNKEIKQVLKELQPIMQQTSTMLQLLSNTQRWDQVEAILQHTIEERGCWKDCFKSIDDMKKALDDMFKEIRAKGV